jgi:hypothetical protein
MFFNHLRSAWRSLSHNISYSIINITGLAAGTALLTVGILAVRAAAANPVTNLRTV